MAFTKIQIGSLMNHLWIERFFVDHVNDSSRSADDELTALLELAHVLINIGTTNGMKL